jgi:hypothetical protein
MTLTHIPKTHMAFHITVLFVYSTQISLLRNQI